MFICSNIPGNSCKQIPTPMKEFHTYRACAIYGYEYSLNTLKNFNVEAVNEFKMYTAFNCKESQGI